MANQLHLQEIAIGSSFLFRPNQNPLPADKQHQLLIRV
jgi:hypothetical protein